MTNTDETGVWVYLDCVERLLADREAGRRRRIEEYERLYPGNAADVRAAYDEVFGSRDAPSGDEIAGQDEHQARLGRFRLIRELGRGGQGTVYLAYDEHLRREIALKVLMAGLFNTREALLRFRREAEVASRLRHSGICKVFDAGSEPSAAYIAMEYLHGETLARRLWREQSESHDSPLTSSEQKRRCNWAARIVSKAARALHAAHEAGVVHRDVKPANLMLAKDDEPVVLDFGLARDTAREGVALTAPGEQFGTAAYMSPEQLGTGEVDRRTDVWSLGVTLYESLARLRPFSGPTRDMVVRAVRREEPASLPRQVPRDLRTIVNTCLSKDPHHRYQTAADLASDLDAYLEGRPIAARPVGPLGRSLRWMRREPVRATLLAVLLVTMPTVAALVAYTVATRPEVELARLTTARQRAEAALEDAYRELAEASDGEAMAAKFEEALTHLPDSPEAVAGRTRLHLLAQRSDAALAYLDTQPPSVQSRPSLQLLRSDALRGLGRSAEADAIAASVAPADAVDFYLLAERELDRGHEGESEAFARARQLNSQAVWRAPHQRPLYLYQRAHIAGHLAEPAEAREVADVLRSSWPDSAEAAFWAGFALMRSGLHGEAEPEFRRAMTLRPEYSNHLGALAQTLAELERWDEAEETFRKALAVPGPKVVIRRELARRLAWRGRLDDAESLLRDWLAEHADDHDARTVLGYVLALRGKLAESEACYRHALEHGVDTAEVRAGLAFNHARSGEFDRALAEFRAAAERAPDDPEHRYNLGLVHQVKGRKDEAVAEYRQALELDEAHDKALTNLGVLLQHEGDLDEAESCFARAVQSNPHNVRATFNLAKQLRDTMRQEEAEPLFRRLAERRPRDPAASAMLGRTLFELGRFEEALAPLQRAREHAGDPAEWELPYVEWLQRCERSLQLAAELRTMEPSADPPEDPRHALDLATVAELVGMTSLAARLYRHVFASAPDIVGTPDQEHLFRAACAAARVAGTGLDNAQEVREWALGRLQEALAQWRSPEVRAGTSGSEVLLRLRRWREASALAPLRDPEKLTALTPDERVAWTLLWQDVERLEREQLGR